MPKFTTDYKLKPDIQLVEAPLETINHPLGRLTQPDADAGDISMGDINSSIIRFFINPSSTQADISNIYKLQDEIRNQIRLREGTVTPLPTNAVSLNRNPISILELDIPANSFAVLKEGIEDFEATTLILGQVITDPNFSEQEKQELWQLLIDNGPAFNYMLTAYHQQEGEQEEYQLDYVEPVKLTQLLTSNTPLSQDQLRLGLIQSGTNPVQILQDTYLFEIINAYNQLGTQES